MSIVWGPPPLADDRSAGAARLVESHRICVTETTRALRVWTGNTVYEIEVTDAARQQVLIRGGQYFEYPRRARVAGARQSASELWRGSIYVGWRLEIHVGHRAIVTSPVHRIEIR